MKKNKILCPVDDSTASLNAVEYASKLATLVRAEVVLLQVIKEPVMLPVGLERRHVIEGATSTEEAVQKKLNEYCELVSDQYGIRCSSVVRHSGPNVDKMIADEIEAMKYSMVVMGTNGADGLRQFYFGTHTYHVLRQISQPIVVVPENCKFREIKKIVIASDYEEAVLTTMKNVLSLTKPFNSHLTFLHVSHEDTEISRSVFRSLKNTYEDSKELDLRRMDFVRKVNDDTARGVHEFMHETGADLLILLHSNYSFSEKLFHRSVAKDLSIMAYYPMIVYHTKTK
jgi:nucleotide-binding universal stress UspA family protein